MQKTWKEHGLKFWSEYAKPFLFIFVIFTAFRSSVADWNDVPTGSMRPTILEGDRIFVNKVAYDLKVPYTTWHLVQWGDPSRGDVVVFFSPADGKRLVKRVVGLPGDTVAMVRERLTVNGVAAQYGPLDSRTVDQIPAAEQPNHDFAAERIAGQSHPTMITPSQRALRSFGPLKVPEGHYFVMGDNRDNSFDSRFFGPVPREQIVGRALAVVTSLDSNDHYLPRWRRFFSSLP